ncbi:MAG: sulfite exporter TauE/SafE family protein [Myxococcota bacterium]
MDLTWIVIPLGIVAGALTTVAGVGGGLVITLALAALWDPHAALAVTAPALLLGNVHRLWLFRRDVDRTVALRLAAPAVVGATAGGLVTAAVPDGPLRWLLLGVTALAFARECGWISPPGRGVWLVGGGLLVGVLTATTGGGGLLLAPLMLAAQLRGATFIATGALVASSIHVARLVTYGGTGLLGPAELPVALVTGLAILLGNTAGRRLRPRLGDRMCHQLTWIVLVGGLLLALLGLGRS